MSYGILVDVNRCSGCMACMVACMDQNDIYPDKQQSSLRQVFPVEKGSYPEVQIRYISLACFHCSDAPCIYACPTGAIFREENGVVQVRQDFCLGCHSCSMACPFGIPRFGADGKMQKCTMCEERVKFGLDPACVHTCPTKALRFGEINELCQQVEEKMYCKILIKGIE